MVIEGDPLANSFLSTLRRFSKAVDRPSGRGVGVTSDHKFVLSTPPPPTGSDGLKRVRCRRTVRLPQLDTLT